MLGRTSTVVSAVVSALVVLAAACSSGGEPPAASTATVPESAATSVEPSEASVVEAAAPSSVDAPTSSATSLPVFDAGAIDWEPLNDAVDVATIEVPVDYADPSGERFELFVARFNALDPDERIGSLLVNPGGPGLGGSYLALAAARIFDQPILDRFDIIAWDPRGTGESDPPIDCIDDYDPYFTAVDGTPETPAEHEALVDVSRDFTRACIDKNESTYAYVGTNNSARDMDVIRRALGEDTISYFGLSYGSELGATWATLFPDTVRAAVLDGATDPNTTDLDAGLQQYAGFEAALERFLARCASDDDCAFHNDGDPGAAFDALLVELDERPIPSGDASRPPVNRDVATTGVFAALYSAERWPALEESLAAAQQGDGAGLMALNDSYYERRSDGTYGNFLEAFPVILCADSAERRTVEEVDAEAVAYHEVAPRLVPADAAGGYTCTFMPPALDPRVEITGAGAGTILVIGTTGDPSTPLVSTERMAEALEGGRLLVVEAERHTGYGANRCVVDAVNDYLIDLVAPDDGTVCS